MKRLVHVTMTVVMMLAVVGCSSTGSVKGADGSRAGTPANGAAEVGRYGTRGLRGAGGPGSGDLDNASGPLAQRVIYFEYDSFDVLPQYVSVVSAHAGYLAAHAGRSLTLEGHADERGSSEYNIALGEQRARAVAKLMTLQGVGEEQIQIVSYGEEKPAVPGHDESSWQQNRRVEINYASD